MTITMDRYEANWDMVKNGWYTHVLGEGRMFASAAEAVETYRAENGCIDQDLPAFVIAENGEPAGRINDGDSVIFFNFRGDRAIEISRAFDEKEFDKYVMNTYKRTPVFFEYGDGVYLYDKEGKKYLDFVSGIAVNILGYNNKNFICT